MLAKTQLYITEYRDFLSDLYRGGHSPQPRFHTLHPGHDAHVYDVNGVPWIKADGKGVSAFRDWDQSRRSWWKILAGTSLPSKLKIVKDVRLGFEKHYMIAPEGNMPLAEFIMLMDQVKEKSVKVS
jgi:hypothetical protein